MFNARKIWKLQLQAEKGTAAQRHSNRAAGDRLGVSSTSGGVGRLGFLSLIVVRLKFLSVSLERFWFLSVSLKRFRVYSGGD